jgi:hypothetical protein
MKYGISYADDPQEYRRRESLARRRADPIGYLLKQVKYRAKITGKDFDLTKEDLDIPSHCPVFGIPLFLTEGRRGPNSYSIDRIDNSKGYTKDNVRVISFLANTRKGDMTLEQVENLLKYMKGEL